MELDLTKLNQLLTVARTRSFSRAAEELHLTQPALSRNIALIEQRYGVRIFDRGPGGVSVTAVGALALADAESLLRDARALEHNLHLYGRGEAGKVIFGAGPMIASLVLPKLGIHLLTARPRLRMRCSIKPANVLLKELLADEIEFLICTTGQISPSPEIVVQSIGEVSVGIIARTGHPLVSKARVLMEDLAAYPLGIAVDSSDTFPNFEGGVICDNYDILRKIVLNTDMLWISSPLMVADDFSAGLLCNIELSDTRPWKNEVVVVRRKRRTSSASALSIVDYVANLLA